MNQNQTKHIVELYKRHGTIDAVVAITGQPRSEVAAIVDAIPNREHYRRRGSRAQSSIGQLISDLRRAAAQEGEPLTIPKYRKASRELGLSALSTILKGFPDEVSPWTAALKAAEVKGNPPRGRRKSNITFAQCVVAVAQCWGDIKERPSYDRYVAWSNGRKPPVPSGPTVRLKGWNRVVEKALELVPESVLN